MYWFSGLNAEDVNAFIAIQDLFFVELVGLDGIFYPLLEVINRHLFCILTELVILERGGREGG